jgi:radical SAM superfamily enzyme YgiQ (UPF0313 family)
MPPKKLQIVVLFQNLGAERPWYARSPAPPLSGILVAALTPPEVEVEVVHEMVRPIDFGSDAEIVALSFMDYCAPHAFDVARRLRREGRIVVAGGRYPSTFPEACLPHFDVVVAGEAERVWPEVVRDILHERHRPLYRAPSAPALIGLPRPRYDLVESSFDVPVVTEGSRGCPFRCTYCALNIEPKPYRTRPIDEVVRDLSGTTDLPWRKRKMAMLLDNNLGGDMVWAKDLLREIAGLKLWALGVQFSLNCLRDEEFLDLLAEANCSMAFLGLESLHEPSLRAVRKGHNRVEAYRAELDRLRERGILAFAGVMLGLDEDTPAYYEELPSLLDEVGPAVILPSISIPIPGTPFHGEVEREGRILDRDLSRYDGDHVVFRPRRVTPAEVVQAFERVNRSFYSVPAVARRWWRHVAVLFRARRVRNRARRAAMLTFVLAKLSRFQHHHARQRVYALRRECLDSTSPGATFGGSDGTLEWLPPAGECQSSRPG